MRANLSSRRDLILMEFVVEDVYLPDRHVEATCVYGDDDSVHPGVAYLHRYPDSSTVHYLGGKVQAIQAPHHYDYTAQRCLWMGLGVY